MAPIHSDVHLLLHDINKVEMDMEAADYNEYDPKKYGTEASRIKQIVTELRSRFYNMEDRGIFNGFPGYERLKERVNNIGKRSNEMFLEVARFSRILGGVSKMIHFTRTELIGIITDSQFYEQQEAPVVPNYVFQQSTNSAFRQVIDSPNNAFRHIRSPNNGEKNSN